MTKRSLVLVALAALGVAGAADTRAEVRLPGLIGDHMVLQQGRPIPIWGWAEAGEAVTVTFGTQSVSTQADAGGRWRVDLAPEKASSQPRQLTVAGRNTLAVQDVLVGEVWLCSGQSNMEFGYRNVAVTGEVVDTGIHTFCVLKSAALEPLDDTQAVPQDIGLDTQMGHWQVEQPGGPWGGFSAVGYFFARELRHHTQAPVGMIGSYWGGTPAQAWTSLAGLERVPALSNYVAGVRNLPPETRRRFPVKWVDYVAAMKRWDREAREPYEADKRAWEAAARKAREAGQPVPPEPRLAFPRPANPGNVGTATSLFNGMINPLVPYAIRGAIWYQGESNASYGNDYATLFPALIRDWRDHWGQGDFPFLFVQLAGYATSTNDPAHGKWPLLREAQARTLALTNTAMATAIDLADADKPGDIHPHNKVDVARRLALLARTHVYGQAVVDGGPVFDHATVEGGKIRIAFRNPGSGLVIGAPPVLPGKAPNPVPAELTGFEVAGADGAWKPARAMIDGETVVASNDQIPAPVAVRYAWADYPACSLYNREGLPAFPFRSDAPR